SGGGAGAGAAEGIGGQVGEGGVAVHGHDQVGFGEDAAQDVDDAVGAADGEAVGVGTADGDGGGAQGQGLYHVGAGTDAGVEQHGHAVGGVDHGRQAVEGGQPAVGLTAAVGGAVDSVHPAIPGAAGVVGVAN